MMIDTTLSWLFLVQTGHNYTLDVANQILMSDLIKPKDKYLDDMRYYFDVAPLSEDFSLPEQARKNANDWVANSTNGRITNLLPQGKVAKENVTLENIHQLWNYHAL